MLLIKSTILMICNLILQIGREQNGPKEHLSDQGRWGMKPYGRELYRSTWTTLYSNQGKEARISVRRNSLPLSTPNSWRHTGQVRNHLGSMNNNNRTAR